MKNPLNLIVDNPVKKVKKNIYIDGRRTSISLEGYVWEQLERLGHEENITVDDIFTEIEHSRPSTMTVTAVIRFLIMQIYTIRENNATTSEMSMHEDDAIFPSPLYQALASIKAIDTKAPTSPKSLPDDTPLQNLKMSS